MEVLTVPFVFSLHAHVNAVMALEAVLEEGIRYLRGERATLGSKVLKAEIWDEDEHVAKTKALLEEVKYS